MPDRRGRLSSNRQRVELSRRMAMRNQRHPIPLLGFLLLVMFAQTGLAVEPKVSIQDAQISEGDAGSKTLDFSVGRSEDNSTNVVVEYVTAESPTNAATAG